MLGPRSGIPPCISLYIYNFTSFSFLLSFLPSCILTPAEETATYADSGVLETGFKVQPFHTLSWEPDWYFPLMGEP